ncbi:DUF2000 domain-containing protein [Aminomonas paucivorans]|uniref:DUF2000 domain-containing protein n=1 Tax=Aminomonas paucivorans TaxID=81412 RepID=UPI0002DA6A71|nr:DUF2000 domain-containing protein [Aminomonas paucivorans]
MKVVLVVDQDLPRGLQANAAAALGLSLGAQEEGLCGPAVTDRAGGVHGGITRVNLPVLAASGEQLRELYRRARESADLRALGFSSLAQRSRDYETYRTAMEGTDPGALGFSGICLWGPPGAVNALAGSLKTLK